jgi:hypothetical protein
MTRRAAVTFRRCDPSHWQEDDMYKTLEDGGSIARTRLSPARPMPRSNGIVIAFWIVTALFCLQIGFTAYAQLRLPQVAEAFTHLGFPAYFRVELALAKLLGVVLLLAPVPPRLKEWAYAGFAFTLVSALIAHLSVGDGPEAWGWAAGTAVLWGLSYFFWRSLQAAPPMPDGANTGTKHGE